MKGVNAGIEGSTIIVRAGFYREEKIHMKNGQILKGSGREITTILRASTGIIVLGTECQVSGFLIKSQWSGTLLDPAVYGEDVKNIVISDNAFDYPDSFSIYLRKSTGYVARNILIDLRINPGCSITVEDNDIIGSPRQDRFGISYGTGIGIIGSSPTIRNNRISNCGVGIYISAGGLEAIAAEPNIYNNIIENSVDYGVQVMPFPCSADFGGGAKGSPGNNTFRNNGKWDFYNGSPSVIYAINNSWTLSDTAAIDRLNISDDDEGTGGQVIFIPIKTSFFRHR